MRLTFVETRVFTERVVKLGLEDAVRELQSMLLDAPEAGRLDAGTGGLRKIRIADRRHGKGKRGGARVHYLWLPRQRRIYLLYAYVKGESETLTSVEKRTLRDVVHAIKEAAGDDLR